MKKIKKYKLLKKIDSLLLKVGLIKKQNWENIKTVFIVSTGRTGTKFFAEFFNLFPHILALHEPKPDFLKVAVKYAQNKIDFNKAVKIIERNRRIFYKDIKRQNCNIYIESNNRFFSLLKPLKKAFPEAKIIYIVRDGRNYVSSGMSRQWYKPQDKQTRLRADMFYDDKFYNKWKKMSRLEKIAWRWQKKDSFIYNDFKDIDDAIKIKFEEIFNTQKKDGIYKINRFIGIDDEITKKYLNLFGDKKININKKKYPKWQKWDKKDKINFDKIAAKNMKKHNYY